MNKDELKKKIVEILKAHIYIDNYGLVHRLDYAEIADALIAAGYGDVKSTQRALLIAAREIMKARGYADSEIEYLAKEVYIPEVMNKPKKNSRRKGKMNVKDRLTAHNKAGQGIINMDGVSDVLEASARIRTFSPLIISKLTEYEDTGLSPNEVNELKAENAALRERLEKAEKEIDEYKNKIEYGKLVEPVWFISFMNDLPCYGRVIGYQEDSGFVMECTDCMISAKEIYFSEKEVLDSLAELKGE